MKAVIYCRTSTDEQDASCADQERVGREKAKALGATVTTIYADDGFSGTDPKRPAFLRMLAAANAKEFDVLVVWKLDRIGRDGPDREKAIRRLEMHGVRIATNSDYDTNHGSLKNRKMDRGIKAVIDEYYIDNLSEDVHRGQENKFLKGFWVGGRPYGYRLEAVSHPHELDPYGRPKQIATLLKIDPTQSKIVKEIFERYAHGASPQTIAADLHARGIPSPGSMWKRKTRRCEGWARSAIWAMLQNPLYSGTYYWDRTQWIKMEGKRVRKARAKGDLKGSVGNAPHLAIISEATWKLVQARLGVNKLKPTDKRLMSGGRAVYMLSGIMKCQCGARFVLDSATHYRCGKALDGMSCDKSHALRVRRDVAEQVILKPLVDELLSPDVIEEMVVEMRRHYAIQTATANAESAKRPAAVAELDARISRLRDRLKAGDPDMSGDELLSVIDKAEAKKAELLASQPEAKRNEKVLRALPAAAKQYRDQITKGLQGNMTEAGRARIAVRQLLGDTIILKPAKDRTHLVAHLQFQRVALLGQQFAGVGSVGSGGPLRGIPH